MQRVNLPHSCERTELRGRWISEKEQSSNPHVKMYTTVVLQSAQTIVPYGLNKTKISFCDVGRYFQHPYLQTETATHNALYLLLLKYANVMNCNHAQNVWVVSPTCGPGTIYNTF